MTTPLVRGDVYWAELPGIGRHPVVVMTRQVAIRVRSTVTVVLVTSVSRGHVAEVSLDVEQGLHHPSVANCDEIYTIPRASLVSRVGSAGPEVLARVEEGIRISLDLG
jgi:mRNA interferase MazF